MNRKSTGNLGESIAADFLERKGYKILAMNYLKPPFGEIDIIAEKKGIVRFVEVKTVSRENDHSPEDLVTREKLQKVARTASIYMEETRDKREYQIDVVGVILNSETKTARCRLLEQVVEGDL